MTTVSTMEQLREIGEGSSVTVNGRSWVVEGQTLVNGTFRIPLDRIEGEVADGRVNLGVTPQVGQVYAAGNYAVWVVKQRRSHPEAPYVVMCDVRCNDPMSLRVRILDRILDREIEMPEVLNSERRHFLLMVAEQMDAAARNEERFRQRDEEYRAYRTRITSERAEEMNSLRESFIEIVDGEGVGPGEDLFDSLDSIIVGRGGTRLPRPTEEVNVTITVDGTTDVTIERDAIEEDVPDGVTIDRYDGEIRVEWTWTSTTTREVEDGECACDEVDRDDIESMMESEGVTSDSWFEYQTSCENCS